MADDPTLDSRWRPLRELLAAMDADLARLYAERGVSGVRPRYSMALIRLHHRGAMTIRELAEALGVTHSAMSQTVTAMRGEGLVRARPGADARTKLIALTAKGRALVPFLEAEWRATEQAVADLEAEIPYALTSVVRDIESALTTRSFHDRVRSILDDGEDEE